MSIEQGTILAGHYRVGTPLGKGGMGEVFSAENTRTGRRVAVKVLRAETKDKQTAIERFRREARAAGVIRSEFVTQVFDIEEDPEHGIVIVFELLEGESLVERLKRTGPLQLLELWGIVEAVWVGLADAHAAGIIHRDLKPSNVFLETKNGPLKVKIMDFGISKLPKEFTTDSLTQLGQSLGTFSFMPPEQIGRAKTVDHRADIYSCATLIYQALSGKLPYQAKNAVVMMELKMRQNPMSLADSLGKPTDPALEAFIARCLARAPEDRFQSALDALVAWRALRPAGAPSLVKATEADRPATIAAEEDPHTLLLKPPATLRFGGPAKSAATQRIAAASPDDAGPNDDDAGPNDDAETLLRRPPELQALLDQLARNRAKTSAPVGDDPLPLEPTPGLLAAAPTPRAPRNKTTRMALGALALMVIGFSVVALALRFLR